MKMVSCIALALTLCACCWAAQKSRSPAPKAPPKSLILDDDEESAPPMTPPTAIENAQKTPPGPLLPDGTNVLDLQTRPTQDRASRWWIITEPRLGAMRMLPCELLVETLSVMREQPTEKLLLSGEVYVYKDTCYFLLRRTAFAPVTTATAPKPAAKAPATPKPVTRPVLPAAPAAPTTQPTSRPANSEEIALSMLSREPPRPMLPARHTEIPKSAYTSITPAREPLKTGPERIVASRIVRLQGPDAEGWYDVAFEADNTLQDPPLRLMPCALLEKIQQLDAHKGAFSHLYYVSGEIHPFGDHAYLMLREVRVKLDLNEF